ncbi:MAG: helix-hairpin-helix domain-containing protein [Bacteroidetes bacterium]|nr:helix-hairpin-helix domain-containing protein [Bacteroidota bacterium]
MKQVLLLTLSLFTCSLYAQTQPDGTDVQEVIENTASQNESESFDYDAFIDELEQFKKNPINLNKADENTLNDLPLLLPTQIGSLLQYISLHGKLISIYELQAVPGFDLVTIQRILPYVMVDSDLSETKIPIKKLFSKGTFTFVSRYKQTIEKSEGYQLSEGNRYLGKPFNLFLRFRYNYGTRLSYGFTAEKDAGEEFFKGSNKQGFDYYSGHFAIRDFSVLKTFIAGDYEVRLGQGLMVWSGFGVRKSPSVLNIRKQGIKLRPYTSLNESNFMRGAAFTVGKKGFEFTAFGSFKQLDATATALNADTSINTEEAFSSFNESGYHRTPNEIEGRNSLLTLTAGGNFSYNQRSWHVGVNGLYNKFFGTYLPTLQPYSQYNLRQNWLVNASIDYRVQFRNVQLFGEQAISNNAGFALLNGALVSLDAKVDIAVVHRYFSRNYQSLFANALAEGSRPQNEHGLYVALSVKPIRQIRIDVYSDLYKSDWLKYLVDAPSWGSDNFLQLTFTPNKKMELYARYRYEFRKRNLSGNEAAFDYLDNEYRQSLRFNIKYKIGELFTLANRVEWSNFKNGNNKAENGYMIYQDIGFRKLGFPLSLNARLAIFKTDGFFSRIYTYENDVLYSFSIPALSGNGLRYYLMLNYNITRNIEVWVRFAQTNLFGVKTIGSSLDEINGNKRSEIKAQIRFKF